MMKKLLASCAAVALLGATTVFAEHAHTSTKFEGAKANKGTVTHLRESGKDVLKLSDDFKTPDTPAPHWQVVDSHGHVYLLNRLVIKGDKYNKMITLPAQIHDVAKVQIWCAWAEVLLGEASFEKPIQLTSR
jgi:hypothetical protein